MRSLLILFILGSTLCFGQITKKILAIKRIQTAITVDGKLDEDAWLDASVADQFVEVRPNNLKPENPETPTRVKMLYDDNAIYIGAEMLDNKADSILTELTPRDDIGAADYFVLMLNPYNDAQQSFEFFVTASGVQLDAFATLNQGEDFNWDAIWDSEITRTETGWFVEIKIPYSALRFPKNTVNDWDVNFLREVRRKRTQYSWSPIDRKDTNFFKFHGKITGINNIEPPTRLFIFPYASYYNTLVEGETTSEFKAGADIKWGINDSFTLDAILIPDFGQTAFDDVRYVLGPFEQQFSERRAFFTEGTDLFEKANLLYTRRIGQISKTNLQLEGTEELQKSPSSANLLNAIKISGRNKNGFGLGIMNALVDKSMAEIRNTTTNEVYEKEYSPLTNYNVLVVDKRYGENNSISFINTNVLRNGSTQDANVSAVVSDIYTKGNKYNFTNTLKYSTIYGENSSNGINAESSFGKVYGKHNFGISTQYMSKEYNQNDFGIMFQRNYVGINPWYSYRILESNKRFNTFNVNVNNYTQINNDSHKLEEFNVNVNVNTTSKKNHYFGFGLNGTPIVTYDHYEPRTAGRYMKNNRIGSFWASFSPNYNNKFVVDVSPDFYFSEKHTLWGYSLGIGPRYRINDQLTVSLYNSFEKDFGNFGYADTVNNDIIIGERDQISNETLLRISYNFTPKMSASVTGRHYWTSLHYYRFHTLQMDGELVENALQLNEDFSYNNYNLDVNFSWWFAPGSQLTFLYRNSMNSFQGNYDANWSNNINTLFKEPLSNVFSLRITYFLDYNRVKKLF